MIGGNSIDYLSRALTASSTRQKVIADNLANVDTPNFKAKGVSFESELQKALSADSKSEFSAYRTDSRHLPMGSRNPLQVNPSIFVRNDSLMKTNGNNVDVDTEMTSMASNQLWYDLLIEQTNGYFDSLRKAIKGGV